MHADVCTERLQVLVSIAESNYLAAQARICKLTLSRYVRRLIQEDMDDRRVTVDSE